jgi:hypothetical protein
VVFIAKRSEARNSSWRMRVSCLARLHGAVCLVCLVSLLSLLGTGGCGLDKAGLGVESSDADSTFPDDAGAADAGSTDVGSPAEAGSIPSAEGGVPAGEAGRPAAEAGFDASDARAGDAANPADTGGATDASPDVVGADVVVVSFDGASDAAPDARSEAGAPPSCVASVPAGWTIAIYDLGPDTCPPGFVEHDVLGAATVGDGACACACDVTQEGRCTQGTLTTFGDTLDANACGAAWFSVPITDDSVCTAIPVTVPATRPIPLSFQAAPLPPQPGACTATLLPDPTRVSAPPARYCDVPAAAAEMVCDGNVPSGFAACIARPGTATCPAGSAFVHPYVVEDGAALACSACGCKTTTTCTDAVLTVHSGARCMDTGVALTVDGTCNPSGFAGVKAATAVEYTATESSVCDAGTSTGSAQLTNQVTLCCL